jgi:hypothetical protein
MSWWLQLSLFSFSIIAITSAVLLTHGFAFLIVVQSHRWFDWPRYLREVKSSLNLRTSWATSARCSWWIWPAVLLIWHLWSELANGFNYATYPLIQVNLPFFIAHVLVVFFGYFVVASNVLRRAVVGQIGLSELRCAGCNYLLRGLESRNCPECGQKFDPSRPAKYGFRWRTSRVTRRLLVPVLSSALLLSPLWVPGMLLLVPQSWLRFVPAIIRPAWYVASPNPDSFPLRLDAVCLVRRKNELAVIRFFESTQYGGRYQAGYWADARMFGQTRPDVTTSGAIKYGGGRDMPAGPWKLPYGWAGESGFWLTRLDDTYRVESVLVDDFDGDLTWVEDKPDKR